MKLVTLDPKDRIAVLGKTGTGKSNWTKEFIAAQVRAGAPVVGFDPLDELSIHGKKRRARKLGPLTQRCTVDEFLEDPVRWLSAQPLALAIVPVDTNEGAAEDFQDVCEVLKGAEIESLFVIEEVGHFGRFCELALENVACRFRHYGMATIFVAQRAVQIPYTARCQLSQIISFAQDMPEDITALRERTELTSPGLADRVEQLPDGEFEHWCDRRTLAREPAERRKAA